MAVHTHTKDLTFREKTEASTLRLQINEARFRFQSSLDKFYRAHNSGYCAYEMMKEIKVAQEYATTLEKLLFDLGSIEHYNFEAVMAIADEEVPA